MNNALKNIPSIFNCLVAEEWGLRELPFYEIALSKIGFLDKNREFSIFENSGKTERFEIVKLDSSQEDPLRSLEKKFKKFLLKEAKQFSSFDEIIGHYINLDLTISTILNFSEGSIILPEPENFGILWASYYKDEFGILIHGLEHACKINTNLKSVLEHKMNVISLL